MKKFTTYDDDGSQVMAIAHMTLWVRWAKNLTKRVGLVQSRHHFMKCNLLLSWYCWKIADLELSNNHWHIDRMDCVILLPGCNHRSLWHGITTPFLTLFKYLFPIKFLYFFIISSLFPYMSRPYIYLLIIHKAKNSESLKIVQLHAAGTFNAPYFHVIQTRTCINS